MFPPNKPSFVYPLICRRRTLTDGDDSPGYARKSRRSTWPCRAPERRTPDRRPTSDYRTAGDCNLARTARDLLGIRVELPIKIKPVRIRLQFAQVPENSLQMLVSFRLQYGPRLLRLELHSYLSLPGLPFSPGWYRGFPLPKRLGFGRRIRLATLTVCRSRTSPGTGIAPLARRPTYSMWCA